MENHLLSKQTPFCHSELTIRRLTEYDLPAADKLRSAVGWNQTQADWSRMLAYETQGCFAAFWVGSFVGTVTTTCYGTELAWIGLMLVDSKYRGRGIGSALMRRALGFLRDAQVDCIQLDATPVGKPVYQKLGFRELSTFHRWKREANTVTKTKQPSQYGSQLLSSHINLDRRAFGADRSEWLQRVTADSEVAVHAEGFAMRRAGALATHLGPVIAAEPTVARELIESLLGDVGGQVIWDVPALNPMAEAMATALGFQPARELTRMAIGEPQPLVDPLLQFAMADLATG